MKQLFIAYLVNGIAIQPRNSRHSINDTNM